MKMPSKSKQLKPSFVVWLLCLLLSAPAVAQDLHIFPKRIVFDGVKQRSHILNLSNSGKDSAIYDISFVQIRMNENGGFENITEPDPGQLFADPYLRYFPRRVVLAPNESQVVKVQLTRTNELKPGEYRSHIYFRSVPSTQPLGEQPQKKTDETSLSIRLTPVYGITIPCIIKVGESTARVAISNLSLEQVDRERTLSMVFTRRGNMSVFGDITITHTSPQGRESEVARVTGFAIYAPGNRRNARITLKEGVNYRDGILKVTYSTPGGGRRAVIAESDLVLY